MSTTSPPITHRVTGIETRYTLSLTGPPVRGRHSSVDTCPEWMRVDMRIVGNTTVEITEITITGKRARKDGTPSLTNASAAWTLTSIWMQDDVPPWLWTIARAVAATAERMLLIAEDF